jgi:hypothetical protein
VARWQAGLLASTIIMGRPNFKTEVRTRNLTTEESVTQHITTILEETSFVTVTNSQPRLTLTVTEHRPVPP